MSTSSLLLGEGAYAKVYDNKDCAIKITEINNEEDLISCVRELYVLQMFLPHTVPFRSCYYKWGCMHFNLEKATCNLNEYTGSMCDEYIITQVLQGLYALHANKIYHRDVKPDNILIKGDSVWLCDFGLSRQFISDTDSGTGSMQSEYYRAPEVWDKSGVYTDVMDIWSVGCVYFKLMYGYHLCETKEQLFDEVPKLVAKESDPLLRGMLEMDPKKRWSAEKCLEYLKKKPDYTYTEHICENNFTRHRDREIWFKKFENKFPEEKRALTHALMLYDLSDDDPENMCCAMAVASMIFCTRPASLLHFAQTELKKLECDPLPAISSFVACVCTGHTVTCGWKDETYSEYINKMFNKKRKL